MYDATITSDTKSEHLKQGQGVVAYNLLGVEFDRMWPGLMHGVMILSKHTIVALSFEQIRHGFYGSLDGYLQHLANNGVRGIKICAAGNTHVAAANGSHWNQFILLRAWDVAVAGMADGPKNLFLDLGSLYRRVIIRLMAPDSSSADWMILGQMFNTLLNAGVAILGESYVKPVRPVSSTSFGVNEHGGQGESLVPPHTR